MEVATTVGTESPEKRVPLRENPINETNQEDKNRTHEVTC